MATAKRGGNIPKKACNGLKIILERAAALGIGTAAVIGAVVYGAKSFRERKARQKLAQSEVPEDLKEAVRIRAKLSEDIVKIGKLMPFNPALLIKYAYEGKPIKDISPDEYEFFYDSLQDLINDLKYYNFGRYEPGFVQKLAKEPSTFSVSERMKKQSLHSFYDLERLKTVETTKGHSLIGAALISPKQAGKEERIRELLSHGVQMTDGDKKLLALYNWEKNIPERKRIHEALRTGAKEELRPKMTEEQIQQIQEGQINPMQFLTPQTRELIYEQVIDPLEIEDEPGLDI